MGDYKIYEYTEENGPIEDIVPIDDERGCIGFSQALDIPAAVELMIKLQEQGVTVNLNTQSSQGVQALEYKGGMQQVKEASDAAGITKPGFWQEREFDGNFAVRDTGL